MNAASQKKFAEIESTLFEIKEHIEEVICIFHKDPVKAIEQLNSTPLIRKIQNIYNEYTTAMLTPEEQEGGKLDQTWIPTDKVFYGPGTAGFCKDGTYLSREPTVSSGYRVWVNINPEITEAVKNTFIIKEVLDE
jgi:hypothetical protein